jgi:hypothetical protein
VQIYETNFGGGKKNTKKSEDFVFFYQRWFSTFSTHFLTEVCGKLCGKSAKLPILL